jgi:hypothetical protein
VVANSSEIDVFAEALVLRRLDQLEGHLFRIANALDLIAARTAPHTMPAAGTNGWGRGRERMREEIADAVVDCELAYMGEGR